MRKGKEKKADICKESNKNTPLIEVLSTISNRYSWQTKITQSNGKDHETHNLKYSN
jgi:hypothetical protein